MANLLSGFLDNVAKGLFNAKGNLGDYAHAARLYNSKSFRLAPKTKFLYHVVFNINPGVWDKQQRFKENHIQELGLLVKAIDLPKFKITVDSTQQYNRKKQVQTRLDYDPINITFHDDNLGVTTTLWSFYYGYYFADSGHGNSIGSINGPLGNSKVGEKTVFPGYSSKNIVGNKTEYKKYRYGLDNDQAEPFFNSIQIFQLSRKQYQSYTLVNPIIESWQHESLENSSNDTSSNKMSIRYEAVIYGQGAVKKDNPKNFAKIHYDNTPSPLSLLGGGAASLFGGGGLLNNGLGLLGDITTGAAFRPENLFGSIVRGANIINNAKKLSTEGLRQEAFGIVTGAITQTTGVNVSGVANVLFPKSTGSSQTTNVTTAVPVQRTTNVGPLNRSNVVNFFNSRPGSLNSLSKTSVFAKEKGLGSLSEINTAWNALSRAAQLEYEEKAVQKVVAGDPEVQNQYQQILRQA
jgi:hypothetical protein